MIPACREEAIQAGGNNANFMDGHRLMA